MMSSLSLTRAGRFESAIQYDTSQNLIYISNIQYPSPKSTQVHSNQPKRHYLTTKQTKKNHPNKANIYTCISYLSYPILSYFILSYLF